jgi:aminomethyltransferase
MKLLKTPLHSWHKSRANMVPFAGFEMPVVYNSPSSISIEHNVVRNHAGIFDVSHMGRMTVNGPDALEFLNSLVPRDLKNLLVGKIAYTFLLNELAGFKDDITVARTAENNYLITWNAGNLWKIWHWISDLETLVKKTGKKEFTITNITGKTAMIAFQGPQAPKLTEKIFGVYPGSWKIANTIYNDISISIFGSGYTGESGCEIIIYNTTIDNPHSALAIWNALLSEDGVLPCGLGSRDTLRTEAGMHLYGNDLNEQLNPVEVGLVFSPLVNFDKDFFIGKSALLLAKEKEKDSFKRVGLMALKKGPSPRAGMKLLQENQEIGFVSSGSFSPLLKIGIGMGFVPFNINVNTELVAVDAEGKKSIPVKIATFPLYNPDEFGSKRKN